MDQFGWSEMRFSFGYSQDSKVRLHIINWLQTCKNNFRNCRFTLCRGINASNIGWYFQWSREFLQTFGIFLQLTNLYILRWSWSRYLCNCWLIIWDFLIGNRYRLEKIGQNWICALWYSQDRGLYRLRESLLYDGGFRIEWPIAETLTHSVDGSIWRETRVKRFVVRKREIAWVLLLHILKGKKIINFTPESIWRIKLSKG